MTRSKTSRRQTLLRRGRAIAASSLSLAGLLGWTCTELIVEPPAGSSSVDLEISMSADAVTRNPGEQVRFTVTVRNRGPHAVTGVVAGDTLPVALGYVAHVASAGSYSPASGIWTIGNMAVNGEAELSLTGVVAGGTTGTVIRNAAGVLSQDFSDPLLTNNVALVDVAVGTQPPPPLGVVFSSDWSAATGSTFASVTDGAKWEGPACSSWPQTLSVVPGSTVGFPHSLNVLRLRDMGSAVCGMLEAPTAIPQSTTHWGRMYFRNDIAASGTHNHVGTYNAIGRIQTTWWSRQGSSSGNGFYIFTRMYYFAGGAASTYPHYRWAPVAPLANNTWYRYEWHTEYLNATTYRLWPRVYTMNGTVPILDASDFMQADYPQSGNHSLESWYAAGNAFGLSDVTFSRRLGLGNEGPPSSSNSGQYWYHARVAISTSGWLGQ